MKTLLPRLHQHLDKTVAAEVMANWSARNEAVRQHRDELAAKLRKLYQPFIKQIIPLLLSVCVGPCRPAFADFDSAIPRFESWRPSHTVPGPFRTHGLRFIPGT
ncbi:MAG: hypothetical protein WAM77_20990 [Xanthobacteraceae bacterium]